MLESDTVMEAKKTLSSLPVNWTPLARKEAASWKVGHWQHPRLKCREKTMPLKAELELGDDYRKCNVSAVWKLKGKERKKGAKGSFEVIMAKNFQTLMTISRREAQQTSVRTNTKHTRAHMLIQRIRSESPSSKPETKEITKNQEWWQGTFLYSKQDKRCGIIFFRNRTKGRDVEIFRMLEDRNTHPEFLIWAEM